MKFNKICISDDDDDDDAVTKQIWTVGFGQWWDWLLVGSHLIAIGQRFVPSTVIFPSGLKVLGKYMVFGSNLSTDSYVVWEVRGNKSLTIAIYCRQHFYTDFHMVG